MSKTGVNSKNTSHKEGIGNSGAEVLNLSIDIPINICAKFNICSLNDPPLGKIPLKNKFFFVTLPSREG
jgi:hypothetical protein